MSIWQSAFLSEFPKGNIQNYHGPPGSLGFVNNSFTSALEHPKGFLINPSRWLRYNFEDRFDRVIGVDISIKGTAVIPIFLIYPPVPSPYFQIVSIGNGVIKLSIAVEGMPNSGRVKLEVMNQVALFEKLIINNSFTQTPFKLRVRWHTTGQVHVWWNDELVAYKPVHAAGAIFPIGDVAIGAPMEAGSGFLPSMDVTYFYVKVLRENGAELKLDKELKLSTEYVDLQDPCWERIRIIQDKLLFDYRTFMGKVVDKLTQEWRNSDNGQPFSKESIDAHNASKDALVAFLSFLRTGQSEYRDKYLVLIEQFLGIVASTDPDSFVEVVSLTKQKNSEIDEECRKKMQLIYDSNKQLKPIKKLMDETMNIIESIAGGN